MVHVPDPSSFQMLPEQRRYFLAPQAVLAQAIDLLGVEMGTSVVLSGITRELRRHLPIEDIQVLLQGLAMTMLDVAKLDVKD